MNDTKQSIPPVNGQKTKSPAFIVKELKVFAFNLYQSTTQTRVKGVYGFARFKRRIKSELTKLQQIEDEEQIYSSTNIFHLNAIWNYCIEIGFNNVKSISKKMKYENEKFVIVDVVSHSGLKWVKIKCKNPYSIQQQVIKQEERSNILILADRYIEAARANKVKFKTPSIEFVFDKGVTSDICQLLKQKSVRIKGNIIESNVLFADDDTEHKTEEKEEDEINESAVNLGPKTMMTLISSLANKEIDDEFWQIVENYVIEREDNPDTFVTSIYHKALDFQYNSKVMMKRFGAKSTQMLSTMVGYYYEEIQYPVMPVIMQYIGNKQIVCCESAWQSVTKLVGMGAGAKEFNRYKVLASKVTVVPDQISERAAKLNSKGMSDMNKAVFGTGDSLKILTVGGAQAFVRKAKQKGVDFYCKVHDVRPFVEQYQVGFKIFKINKGFDIEELDRVMEEDESSEEEDEDENDDECLEVVEEHTD